MNLQSRVGKLEQATGGNDAGLCACTPGGFEVRYYSGKGDQTAEAKGDTRPAAACAMCGLERRVIKVVRTESRKDVRL